MNKSGVSFQQVNQSEVSILFHINQSQTFEIIFVDCGPTGLAEDEIALVLRQLQAVGKVYTGH